MKRAAPWEKSLTVSSDDSSDSDSEDDVLDKQLSTKDGGTQSSKDLKSEGALVRRAEMYQEYMGQIHVPAHRGSVVPFTSWQGLAKSVKQLYGQPLHYLTNILLKQWDQSRVGRDDEHQPLDTIIHPAKAEALIWVTEEVHRLSTSHHYLAKLWANDPMYHAYIDPIFPSFEGFTNSIVNVEALDSKKKKHGGVNFEVLSKHGYRGGPSVLKVPPPRVEDKEQDWSWSTGKEPDSSKTNAEESYEERRRTRAAVAQGEQLLNARTNLEASRKDKNLSFSQKEKRKRDLGQASRGKNYVEEEKRLLRESGIYSGFDS